MTYSRLENYLCNEVIRTNTHANHRNFRFVLYFRTGIVASIHVITVPLKFVTADRKTCIDAKVLEAPILLSIETLLQSIVHFSLVEIFR